MSEFDDRLSAILSDSNAMGQIMALAQSLSGPGEEGGCPEPEGACPCPPEPGRDVRLLQALQPYLSPERRGRLDRMLEILRLLRMLRGASSN